MLLCNEFNIDSRELAGDCRQTLDFFFSISYLKFAFCAILKCVTFFRQRYKDEDKQIYR